MHTIVWIPMVFAAIAAGAVVSALSKREIPPEDQSANTSMEPLRTQALFANARAAGIRAVSGAAWAVVMDSAYDGGCLSLVALIDGSTTLYFQGGGGVIGAGKHTAVRAASIALVRAADRFITRLSPATSGDHPIAGRTRFFVRTDSALLCGEGLETALGEGEHPLSDLFHAGQDVIAAIREATAVTLPAGPRAVDKR